VNKNLVWRAATSPALTVHTAKEETAYTPVFCNLLSPLAQCKGTPMPNGATAFQGTGARTAGFRASGINGEAQVIRMAAADRSRLTGVPGVLPRGAPV
jgi:hypothetical protein